MVDLAGTERNQDSAHHDAKLRKETTEINKSLMALKDCVRERAQGAAHMVLASNVPLEMSCCMLHRVFGVCGPAPVPPALCNTWPPLPAQHCCPAPCRGTGRCVDLSSQPVCDAIHWNFPHPSNFWPPGPLARRELSALVAGTGPSIT